MYKNVETKYIRSLQCVIFPLCVLCVSVVIIKNQKPLITMSNIEETDFDEAMSNIQERVNQAIEGERFVYYSAYEHDSNEIPINNLDDIAVKGKVYFFEEHVTTGPGTDYTSPIVENPTWLQVAILANEMIKTTGDTHHIFLENIEILKEENGIKQMGFRMGS